MLLLQCKMNLRPVHLQEDKAMLNVFFTQILYFPDILAWLDHIVIKLIPRVGLSDEGA